MTHPTIKTIFAAILLSAGAMGAAHGVEASLSITLNTDASADIQKRSVNYDCGEGAPISADYINASPNFLALLNVPEETEKLVFASTVSASGVRYVSGKWAWWTDGSEASLYDTTLGDDAPAVSTCSEASNAP